MKTSIATIVSFAASAFIVAVSLIAPAYADSSQHPEDSARSGVYSSDAHRDSGDPRNIAHPERTSISGEPRPDTIQQPSSPHGKLSPEERQQLRLDIRAARERIYQPSRQQDASQPPGR